MPKFGKKDDLAEIHNCTSIIHKKKTNTSIQYRICNYVFFLLLSRFKVYQNVLPCLSISNIVEIIYILSYFIQDIHVPPQFHKIAFEPYN